MSDAAIAQVVAGLITITTVVVGFLTLWVKLKYGADQAKVAAPMHDTDQKAQTERMAIAQKQQQAAAELAMSQQRAQAEDMKTQAELTTLKRGELRAYQGGKLVWWQ